MAFTIAAGPFVTILTGNSKHWRWPLCYGSNNESIAIFHGVYNWGLDIGIYIYIVKFCEQFSQLLQKIEKISMAESISHGRVNNYVTSFPLFIVVYAKGSDTLI